jgi:hypothetical protein
MLSAMAHGVRSAVVLMAIEHAASSDRMVAPWLAALLVERWTAAQHAYLRLLASFPGNNVPEDIVPPEERLDLDTMERENAAAGARLDALLEAGQRSGQAVYVLSSSDYATRRARVAVAVMGDALGPPMRP